jgi:N-carbamoylputrescine amidase
MAIAITYLEAHEPAPRNVVSLIDRHGEIVLRYAKVTPATSGQRLP